MASEEHTAGEVLALLFCALMISCSTVPAPVPEPDPLDQHFRGGVGVLSPEEVSYFQWLAWPQIYDDMVGTFGLAHQSTATADIYRVEDTDWTVVVFYDGSKATGYEVRK